MSSRTSVPFPAEVPGAAVGEGASATASFSGVANGSGGGSASNFVVDTGYTPNAVAGGAFVKVRINAYDPTTPADAVAEYNVAVLVAAGTMTLPSPELIGTNAGTSALAGDLSATFAASSKNTLQVTVILGAYTHTLVTNVTVKIST